MEGIREQMEGKGYTVVFIPWEDMEGREKVIGRFGYKSNKDKFIKEILSGHTGMTLEEINTVTVIDDYNYAPTR